MPYSANRARSAGAESGLRGFLRLRGIIRFQTMKSVHLLSFHLAVSFLRSLLPPGPAPARRRCGLIRAGHPARGIRHTPGCRACIEAAMRVDGDPRLQRAEQ